MPPKKTSVEAKLPENKYLTPEALLQTVAESLARLELDKHQARLAILMHGEDVMVSEAESATNCLLRLDEAIKAIETEYADVLKENK